MEKTARGLLYGAALWISVGYGCGGDSDKRQPRGAESGEGGASGESGARGAGEGGAVGLGGRASAGEGGADPLPAAGAAGANGGAAGDEGTAASAGVGGHDEPGGAGGAGAGGEAAAAGVGGEAAAAGAGGAPSGGDPRCASIGSDATVTAHLRITADNECDVVVNGEPVGSTTNWGAAVTIDVSLFVHPGRRNVVAVVGRNTSSQGGNDRGIIGELTTTVAEAEVPLIVTNYDWLVSQTPGEDWTSLDYDDSSWIEATEIAAVGDAPWGAVLQNPDARWIWFAPIPASTTEKPNEEATYARRVFYFDSDGALTAEPLCDAPESID